MSQVKDNNYFSVQGWMVTKMNLSGNDLLIYAIIYGFSQTTDQHFTGSLQYLADFTNSTRRGVQKNLESLIKKGHIRKIEKVINNVKFCDYSVTESYRGCRTEFYSVEQSSQGCRTKFVGGVEQSSTHNIEDNIEKNITQYSGRTTLNKSGKTFNQITNQPESIPEPEQDALDELQIRGLLTALNQDRWRIAIEQLELKGLDLSRFTEYLNYLASDKYSWRKAKLSPDFVVQEIADFLTETTPLNPMEQYYVTDQSGEKYFHPIFASKKLKRGPQEELKQFLQRQRQVQTGKLKIYDAKQLEMALC